ncbi:MAG: metal-dependent hydrolase [Desulfomonilaceae bacterium]
MVLGHFALASIAKQTCFQRENWVFLAGAAVLPDLLDKPASILLGVPGRGVGHSLFILISITLVAWILSSKLKISPKYLVVGTVMWASHLATDFVSSGVLLWPILGALEPAPPFDFWNKIYEFYIVRSSPEEFWLEVFCITAAVGLWAVRFSMPKLAKNIQIRNPGGNRK